LRGIATALFMTETLKNNRNPIVLFDGYCNLCSSAVQFLLKRDKEKVFKYASLQSDFGIKSLAANGLSTTEIDTIVLLENGIAYTHSTAALKIAKYLSGIWPLFYAAIIIPTFLRDAIYKYISKNRYRWFGKKDTCMMLPPGSRIE
jgi:predicted DCC family thiol-disulfide oxidoreductase YuxK